MCWLKRTPISTSRAIAARTSVASLGRQLVTGEADVAAREVEEAAQLAVERGGLRRARELDDGGGDVRVERKIDGPALETLRRDVAGGPDVGVGMDEGHEAGSAHGVGDHSGRGVERQQCGVNGARCTGLHRRGDDDVGLGDRPVGLGGDRLRSGVGVVEHRASKERYGPTAATARRIPCAVRAAVGP